MTPVAVVGDPIVERCRARTPASRALAERAAASMPLGVSANVDWPIQALEAMRNCIRIVRAVTGRSGIAKIEGHHHGSDDGALFSSKSPVLAGTRRRPLAFADSPGLAPRAAEDVVLLPGNDAAGARDRRDAIAADTRQVARFLLGMVDEGVMWMPAHSALMCAVHTHAGVESVLAAAERVIPLAAA